jgi:16S rRNA (cytosine967-C5)-methyltransferase
VNAVLRRVAERRESLGPEMARRCEDTMGLDVVERLAIETSHPLWMVNRWVGRYGLEEAQALCRANNIKAPLTLRVNTLTITRKKILNNLAGHGIDAVPGRYAPEAVMIRDYSGYWSRTVWPQCPEKSYSMPAQGRGERRPILQS